MIARAIGILLLSGLGIASRAQATVACDRACLEGSVDQYLAALAAGDPGKLPLAKNARYTENSCISPIRRPEKWASSARLKSTGIR